MLTVSIACLTMGVFLGVGSGAVFKLVPQEFPENPGAATGIVGAVGGIGGFFPPVVMGLIKGWTRELRAGVRRPAPVLHRSASGSRSPC